MEIYLVYEFIYNNYDEDIEEGINFFGLYQNEEEAKKIAERRIKVGKKENDVVLRDISNKKHPFEGANCVDMYRKDENLVSPIYSICIEKFIMKGNDKNEQSNINGKINKRTRSKIHTNK